MATTSEWIGLMTRLGADFSKRCASHDDDDSFVVENYAALKEHGAFGAGVPAELGGGGASHADLCGMIRELAHHCSATALAFSMHTHPVAAQAYMWRAGNKVPEPLLRRVASEKLVISTSGGSDWLNGSGKLEKVEGGFRLTGKKIFGSGSLAADLLLTTGIYDDPKDGPTVINVPVSLKAEGVKILDTWRVLGMRGTGSHDIQLEGVFIPEAAAGLRRPVGKWHPFMHTISLVALPVLNAAYLGTAEAARDLALKLGDRKKNDPLQAVLVGEMENQLITAQLAHASLVQMVLTEKPGPATTAALLARRTIFGTAAVKTVEKAMEVAGGPGFYRDAGLERLFRDIQAVKYHPIPEKPQTLLTGRVLLGLDIDT
ncbi:MAG TPA: acyl-CoA dehydrogenase family protein [Polyangia bacterium]|nr:acyl-CoA dehydrogenase family protein [Polyangia bacterium]